MNFSGRTLSRPLVSFNSICVHYRRIVGNLNMNSAEIGKNQRGTAMHRAAVASVTGFRELKVPCTG